MENHHWITLHRVRFSEESSALERSFELPATAECWRFCPSQNVGPDGLPLWRSDVWCGLGVFETRDAAEKAVSDPADFLPFLADVEEGWHALTMPVTHRGEVNWRGEIEKNAAVQVADKDPSGPLAVITTAGFWSSDASEHDRIARFLDGVEQVVDFFGESEGNLRRGVFNGGFDGREGFTVSLWRDDKAMMKAAYWEGTHRRLMDESRDGSFFDRSSFTRARILSSHGSWDGDPLQSVR